MSRVRAYGFAIACAALAALPSPARAALAPAQRALLQHYVGALVRADYAAAFALLSPDERRYFGSAANFASVYAADRVKIDRFTIVGSKSDKLGTVALVSERIEFFNQTRQLPGRATAKVAYGILRTESGYVIKDPYHPWRALAPGALVAERNRVRVTVRTFSFYTGRMEMVATFANLGDKAVTLLPYGRTTLRDQNGKTFAPIASRSPGLTDATLYTGLVLPGSAQYTGLMTFLTPDRFEPKSLTLTIAPALLDGGDAPFVLTFPPYSVPS